MELIFLVTCEFILNILNSTSFPSLVCETGNYLGSHTFSIYITLRTRHLKIDDVLSIYTRGLGFGFTGGPVGFPEVSKASHEIPKQPTMG